MKKPSLVGQWLKNQGMQGKLQPKDAPPPPPPPDELTYKFTNDEHGPGVVVEVPMMLQTPIVRPISETRLTRARDDFGFVYLRIDCATGSIRRQYSDSRLPLDEVGGSAAELIGWSFMLGAVELVNVNQFENHHLPADFIGFNPMWDIASMMESGERCLFLRSAYPHALMLKFSNQLRMLVGPIQSAQRAQRSDHIRLYKLIKAKDTSPNYVTLLMKMRVHYAENFTPPELVF